MNLLTYESVRSKLNGKPSLLLGNGFSVACRHDIFTYKALYQQADFALLSDCAKEAFSAIDTVDFEEVIRSLLVASKLAACYATIDPSLCERFESDADGLKNLLAFTIAKNHPELPSDIPAQQYAACRRFLSPYERVYTLNYDLLLYWAIMQDEPQVPLPADDGFRQPDIGPCEYVTWDMGEATSKQKLYYLHGALHIFDKGSELRKFTWRGTGKRLVEQIRSALDEGMFPRIVAEGTSDAKLERIMHSAYLARGLRSLQAIGNDLVIFGMALSENDEHVLSYVVDSKVRRVFVGVYGDPDAISNKELIQRAQILQLRRGDHRPLEVHFYDSASAKPWGK